MQFLGRIIAVMLAVLATLLLGSCFAFVLGITWVGSRLTRWNREA